jgi:hypothetical protein
LGLTVFFKALRSSRLPNGPTGNKAPVDDVDAFFSFLLLLFVPAAEFAVEAGGDAVMDTPVASSFSPGVLDILVHSTNNYNHKNSFDTKIPFLVVPIFGFWSYFGNFCKSLQADFKFFGMGINEE